MLAVLQSGVAAPATECNSNNLSIDDATTPNTILQESLTLFIEKIILAFDSSGEINTYWLLLQSQIHEEKGSQKLLNFVKQLTMSPKQSAREYEMKSSRRNSVKQSREDYLPLQRSHSKKQSTIVKTVQIDMNRSSNIGTSSVTTASASLNSTQRHSRKLSTDHLQSINSLPKNGTAILSPRPSVLVSRLSQQQLATYSSWSSPVGQSSKNVQRKHSEGSDVKSKSPASIRHATTTTFTNENAMKPMNGQQSSPDKCDCSNNREASPEEKKRCLISQFDRVIDEIQGEQQKSHPPPGSQNQLLIQNLLQFTQKHLNRFRKDNESLSLIHGRFTFATEQNCRNSMGVETLQLSFPPKCACQLKNSKYRQLPNSGQAANN